MDKIIYWEQQIANYPKLHLSKAKQKLIKAREENDLEEINNIIMSTLYVVINHIKSNELYVLENSSYDLDDIICVFIEQWMEIVKNYRLLEIDNYAQIFNSNYYTEVKNKLCTYDYSISDNTIISSDIFGDLFRKYLDLKEEKQNIELAEFKKQVIGDRYLWYGDSKYDELLLLFEEIYNSMNLQSDSNFKMSATRLKMLKYLLITNSLEERIDETYGYEFEDDFITDMLRQDSIVKIFNSHLTSKEKKVIELKYGIFSGKTMTYSDVGKELHLSGNRIKQIEAKAIRKLRCPLFSRNLVY